MVSAVETGADGIPVRAGRSLSHAKAVLLAESYVAAYNDRDLEAMLALQDEQVISYPSPLFGMRRLTGHEGVRAWWEMMVLSGRWYEVVAHDIRELGLDRVVILGEIRDRGERLSPWGVVVRVRNGLIIESHSYLSDEKLLEEVGLLR